MLKKFTWIAAALLVSLAIAFFGCTNMGELDDDSGPKPSGDLVYEGDDLVGMIKACGSSSSKVVIDGAKVTLDGNNTGFYFDFPEAAAAYLQVQVFFEIKEVFAGTGPGLLIKRNTSFVNAVGITSDQDPAYQLNNVGPAGTKFDTGLWSTNRFDNQMAFQNQIYNPAGNDDSKFTVEVLKIVFPGNSDAKVIFDADGGAAVPSITVTQGVAIGVLPTTTKTGNAFLGWYTTTVTKIDGEADIPAGTEVLSDFVVPFEDSITLKAKWSASGVTLTKNSLIHANPAFSDPTNATAITVGTNGSATFVTLAGWPSVKYKFPTEVITANGSGTLNDPYTYKYNVVELTVTTTEDFVIQVQADEANGNINRYPSGNEVVTLKKGVENKFSVALYDSGWGGLAIQCKSNEDDNKAGTIVTIVSAVFTEGTLYQVSFDRTVPVRNTDVPTQTVISGRYAKRPTPNPTLTLDNGTVIDFEGWYLNGKLYDFSTAVTADIDIQSRFGKVTQRIITFNPNGGTFTGDLKLALSVSGDKNPTLGDISSSAVPSKTADPTGAGTWAGWWDVSANPAYQVIDPSGSVASAVSSNEVEKDLTLTARWAPGEDKVITTFTQSGGYGATATGTANQWTIGPSWQMLRFDLGDVYQSYDYPKLTIEATFVSINDQVRLNFYDASGVKIGSDVYETPGSTTWSYDTATRSGGIKYISIENGDGTDPITITMTSITFKIN